MSNWLDFNDAPLPDDQPAGHDAETLRHKVLARLPEYLQMLLPNGRVAGHEFVIGNVDGDKGKSLKVTLDGESAGLWKDFANDKSGDIFTLTEQVKGFNFQETLEFMARWLGEIPASLNKTPRSSVVIDELGPETGRWNYENCDGQLIATVTRYDPPNGKEFRPWDVQARKHKAPNPRPIYNQPGIAKSQDVLLVEGEKCAEALIKEGFCATTAMNGANAPVEKTDWSPLKNKRVVIWPDNDMAGMHYAFAAANAIADSGAQSVQVVRPPDNKPQKWDAADAINEGFNIHAWLATTENKKIKESIPTYTFGEMLDDDSPMPEDLLSPRILGPSGLLLLGGAPKVGKSDFLLNLLTHMAAGLPFLDMRPPRPLKIFYLQAEVQYHYLRERVKQLPLEDHQLRSVRKNLVLTGRLKQILDEKGLALVVQAILAAFPEGPDVIVVDPIRNVFDSGPLNTGENDNPGMMFFLQQRIEQMRDRVNPDAGLILVHHTKKISKQTVEEEPFQAFSGAHALRGYYTAGMLLFRPDEEQPERMLYHELRNGSAIKPKRLVKTDNAWQELAFNSTRVAGEEIGKKHDAERQRKKEVILQVLYDEAQNGMVYTSTQFAEVFENKNGLGAKSTIINRLKVLASKGYIKYFRNYEEYNLPSPGRSKFGYMCVEGMQYGTNGVVHCDILPTDYKCKTTGAVLPVENPEIWVNHDG